MVIGVSPVRGYGSPQTLLFTDISGFILRFSSVFPGERCCFSGPQLLNFLDMFLTIMFVFSHVKVSMYRFCPKKGLLIRGA